MFARSRRCDLRRHRVRIFLPSPSPDARLCRKLSGRLAKSIQPSRIVVLFHFISNGMEAHRRANEVVIEEKVVAQEFLRLLKTNDASCLPKLPVNRARSGCNSYWGSSCFSTGVKPDCKSKELPFISGRIRNRMTKTGKRFRKSSNQASPLPRRAELECSHSTAKSAYPRRR